MVRVRLTGLGVRRGRVDALVGVDLAVEAGAVMALVGPNGAGKSTLLGAVAGRLRPTAGDVEVQGTVADVPQTTVVDPEVRLPVVDVVRMGRYPARGLLRRFRPEDHDAVAEAIVALGLAGLERRPLDRLSGGQRQRTLVAQGLAQGADVLLLDEPTAALDVPSQRLVADAIAREARRGATVLFATHSFDEARRADLVAVLAGRLVAFGPPGDILARPEVAELFAPPPLRAAPADAIG